MKWFESSTGTGDLALTVKGLLVALVPLSVSALKGMVGVEVAESQVIEIIEAVFAVLASAMILVGLVRKLINRAES